MNSEEEAYRILKKHGEQVENRLRKMLAERYNIDDPVEVQIAIKTKKLRYYEIVELPPEIVRMRVYAYDDEYMFCDTIMNTPGDSFETANTRIKVELLLNSLIETQNLTIRGANGEHQDPTVR